MITKKLTETGREMILKTNLNNNRSRLTVFFCLISHLLIFMFVTLDILTLFSAYVA